MSGLERFVHHAIHREVTLAPAQVRPDRQAVGRSSRIKRRTVNSMDVAREPSSAKPNLDHASSNGANASTLPQSQTVPHIHSGIAPKDIFDDTTLETAFDSTQSSIDCREHRNGGLDIPGSSGLRDDSYDSSFQAVGADAYHANQELLSQSQIHDLDEPHLQASEPQYNSNQQPTTISKCVPQNTPRREPGPGISGRFHPAASVTRWNTADIQANQNQQVISTSGSSTCQRGPRDKQIEQQARIETTEASHPFHPDYDDQALKDMTYAQLKDQDFETEPNIHKHQIPKDSHNPRMSIGHQIQHHVKSPDDEAQSKFYEQMTIADWEEAGDWFLAHFGELLGKLKAARQTKRNLVAKFEREIEVQERAARGKAQNLDKELKEMRSTGESVLKGTAV